MSHQSRMTEDLSIECKDIPRTHKLTNVLEMKCFLENLLIICGETDRYIFQNFLVSVYGRNISRLNPAYC